MNTSSVLHPYHPLSPSRIIGREQYIEKIQKIALENTPAILIVYGRRRIGKTTLIEHTLGKRNLLKFEGIQGRSKAKQIQNCLDQLSAYVSDPLVSRLKITAWKDFFELLFRYTQTGSWTLYLEELQWLANYRQDLVADLKFAWDNYLQRNKQMLVVLCSSSPSFMIKKVVHSKALYNRSQHEIALRELTLREIKLLLKPTRSLREVMDAFLSVGGIPEYLRYVDGESSVYLGLCRNAFTSDSFFLNEYEKILVSSLADNPLYRRIIEFLSKVKNASRQDITNRLKIQANGSLVRVLEDLELCGFIRKYIPFDRDETTTLARYEINDNYLQFYFHFVKPLRPRIKQGDFDTTPYQAVPMSKMIQWLGYGFERLCRQQSILIARALGFEGVAYKSGPYFTQGKDQLKKGGQIDLVFSRSDKVTTVCEVKYTDNPIGTEIITSFEQKLNILSVSPSTTIQRVLISAAGATKELEERRYFDRILQLKDLFK